MPFTASTLSEPSTRIISTIGRNLKSLRRQADITQDAAAQALGITYQQIQKYEKGRNRITAEKLYRLKLLYNVPYEAFFDGLLHKD